MYFLKPIFEGCLLPSSETTCQVYNPCFSSSPLDCKAVEVLLKSRAYVVKRLGTSGSSSNGKTGQVTWSKFGGAGPAWVQAKKLALWPKSTTKSE